MDWILGNVTDIVSCESVSASSNKPLGTRLFLLAEPQYSILQTWYTNPIRYKHRGPWCSSSNAGDPRVVPLFAKPDNAPGHDRGVRSNQHLIALLCDSFWDRTGHHSNFDGVTHSWLPREPPNAVLAIVPAVFGPPYRAVLSDSIQSSKESTHV